MLHNFNLVLFLLLKWVSKVFTKSIYPSYNYIYIIEKWYLQLTFSFVSKLVQNQKWKHQNDVSNLFKVNNSIVFMSDMSKCWLDCTIAFVIELSLLIHWRWLHAFTVLRLPTIKSRAFHHLSYVILFLGIRETFFFLFRPNVAYHSS